MSWLDRLQPNIKLTSPEGNEFFALWRGNERSKEKKLGLFTYPDLKGTITQDLNISSTSYPITIFFTGSDHDKTADRFFKSCDELGNWKVVHPTKGTITLQLQSVSEKIDPIENGNITEFNLQFIEPADAEIEVSKTELQSGIKTSKLDASLSAIDNFTNNVTGAIGNARTAINNATSLVKNTINAALAPISAINDSVKSAVDSILRGIDSTVNTAVFAPSVLASQLNTLVQLPAEVAMTATEKISAYENLINEVKNLSGSTKETFAVKDLVLSSALGALADIASDTDAITRSEIIDQVTKISELFDGIISNLESDELLVETNSLKDQYISQEGNFPQNLLLVAKSINYLLKASIDLSVEKRFILKEDTAPIMICIKEYGTDSQLDFFYQTNNLFGEDMILLPAGREVVVYPGVV